MAKMVDRIVGLMNNPKQIRNIATSAHIDHGKTTFSDNLLSGAGMMSEELAGKALQLDFHEDEQERGITIDSASVSMVHAVKGKEYLINLIDTPGHVDFGGDVSRAMRAVDGTIVLTCAVEGMMPQTETVLKQALREMVKPILFINKVDRMIKEQKLTPEAMQAKFISIIAEVNKTIEDIAPDEYKQKWKVNVNDGSVCFGSAFHNWGLSIPYMKEKNITFKEIIDAYENDTWQELKKKAPLHEVVLNAVIEHHPDPVTSQDYRIPKIWHGDSESPLGLQIRKCDAKAPLVFVVTKIVVDPQAGEICAGRMFSGTIHKGDNVYVNSGKIHTRVQQVYVYNGAKREIVDDVPCGNIIGVSGLKNVYPGETVSLEPMDTFEAIGHIFEPVITKSIEAKKPSDLPKLIEILIQITKEDPSIKIDINQETGEHLMSGMGELHLEVIENRIKSEKGLDVSTSPPIVVYRETVTKESQTTEGKSPNKHNKIYFHVEPLSPEMMKVIRAGELAEGRVKKKDNKLWEALERGGMDTSESRDVRDVAGGNLFVDGTKGVIHMNEIIEMVLDMFEDVMKKGPIANEPCFGVKVIIDDVKLHEDAIHRGPAQMYPAVREGIRASFATAKPMLFEPVQTLQFEAPVDFMGEVSKIVASKRGQLLDVQQEGNHVTMLGKIPVGEMFGLSNELRSGTEGRGNFFVQDQSFEKLPEELQQKIKGQIRNRKGITSESDLIV